MGVGRAGRGAGDVAVGADELFGAGAVVGEEEDEGVGIKSIQHLANGGVEGIDGAEAYRVDGDHGSVVAKADRFVPTLLRAIDSAVERSGAGRGA